MRDAPGDQNSLSPRLFWAISKAPLCGARILTEYSTSRLQAPLDRLGRPRGPQRVSPNFATREGRGVEPLAQSIDGLGLLGREPHLQAVLGELELC